MSSVRVRASEPIDADALDLAIPDVLCLTLAQLRERVGQSEHIAGRSRLSHRVYLEYEAIYGDPDAGETG